MALRPSQALRYFYFQGDDALLKDETEYDIIKSAVNDDEAVYQLAFAVNKGFTPERNFSIASRATNAPAVCIEGIRASGTLPGFAHSTERSVVLTGTNNLCAILAVQGNKKFRTTVSRMDLEQDDEFAKVSELCGKMFFRHIEFEVERISDLPNRPFSQASTAGNWMYARFKNAAATKI